MLPYLEFAADIQTGNMGILKRLLGLFKKEEKQEEVVEKPTNLQECPFCWGYQEFGDEKRTMGYDKQIDVKNHRDKNVKVGKFMVEHVDGFKNRTRVVERCPKCGGKKIKFVDKSK